MKSYNYVLGRNGSASDFRSGIRPLKGGYPFLKRVMDLSVVFFLGLMTLPAILIFSLLVRLFSPGSAFFVHERIGYRGKVIGVWKLRTMYIDADRLLEEHLIACPKAKVEWERYFKLKNDPRIIPYIGTFLRKSSLDELPQLWNVLKGEMSLVGPRPFPTYHLDSFSKDFQWLRQQVMPGLTGLWQVSARSDGDVDTQELLDREYIEKRSFWFDLKIIAKTFGVVVLQKGAC